MTTFSPRRTATAVLMIAGLGLSATACGNGGGSNTGGGDLVWSWWGSDPRHAVNEAIIEDYESETEGVATEGQSADSPGSWARLAPPTAGGDPPDVITMDEKFLQDYAGRGALMDLSELPNP
ncbi:hypothetical protein AC792_11515, partial [Arthrobacter sp. RIT-PI-e]